MTRLLVAALAIVTTLLSVAYAQQPITYVDANAILPDPLVVGDLGSATGNTSFSAIDATRNGQWTVRDFGVGGELYQASGSNFGELSTTISAVDAGTEYNVYAFFWSAGSSNWFIDASLEGPLAADSAFISGNRNAVNNASGPVFEAAALDIANINDVNGTNPLPLSRSTPGVNNIIELELGIGSPNADNQVSDSGPDSGDQDLFAVKIGSTVASQAGEITAYIRNLAGGDRVWYDGLGYQVFNDITLTVDIASGEATLGSRSSLPVTIGAYEILSDSGALNTGWNGLSDTIPTWAQGTNTANALSEASDLGVGGSLTTEIQLDQGDAFDLGGTFLPGSAEDLEFNYFRTTDSTIQSGEVKYILAGDYNDDGSVDAADYTVWRDNFGAVAGTLPNDLDGGVIGVSQYERWVANFGSMASAAVAANPIPEPTAMALIILLLAGGGYTPGIRGRRDR